MKMEWQPGNGSRAFMRSSALVLGVFAWLAMLGCDTRLSGLAFSTDQELIACGDLARGSLANTVARTGPVPNVQVCLLRGLNDVFSVGLDSLGVEMTADGLDAEVHSGPDWSSVGSQIVTARAQKANPPGLVLIGHSYGADDALHLAEYFRDRNIPVRLAILMDATSPTPVPSNIDRCLHLYNLWPPGEVAPDLFSGNPVVAAPGNNHTIITNEIISPNNPDPGLACVNHFNIDASARIHQRVIDEVFKLTD